MKAFHCDSCASLVFFENSKCVKCDHQLGFLPDSCDLSALEPADKGTWRPMSAASKDQTRRLCNNGQQYKVCNWMIGTDDANPLCVSCRLNQLIPDLSVAGNQDRWQRLEMAKRRVIYTILRLGLPLTALEKRPALRFNFVADVPGAPPITTGHANGLIVVNIAEADDAERERRRVNLHEPYRTLLGHFRHEIAHYFWDRLIADGKWLQGFRKYFGDETADYTAALKRHYAQGPPTDWQERHVSAYAASHPWEDWAETWAHYFHILDMTETAQSYGMTLAPAHPAAASMISHPLNPYDLPVDFDSVLQNWFPLTYALNAINRGMGLLDVYPFALSTPAIDKLKFIHEVVKDNRGNAGN